MGHKIWGAVNGVGDRIALSPELELLEVLKFESSGSSEHCKLYRHRYISIITSSDHQGYYTRRLAIPKGSVSVKPHDNTERIRQVISVRQIRKCTQRFACLVPDPIPR